MQNQAFEPCEVIVAAPELLHQLLAEAEAELRVAALDQRTAGILVTRHEHHRYTLALDEAVPFGETREQSLF
jgi:hypothetical protein